MNSIRPITIHVFGVVAERLATTQVELTGIHDTDGILEWIRLECASLKDLYIGIAVNRQMVTQNTPITSESEITLLPPFSRG